MINPKKNPEKIQEKVKEKRIFLYLDQAHTVGTDIKLNDNNASCITTVSDLLNIKDFLQALLRARQLLEGIEYNETSGIQFLHDKDGNSVPRQRMRFLWISKISDQKIDRIFLMQLAQMKKRIEILIFQFLLN